MMNLAQIGISMSGYSIYDPDYQAILDRANLLGYSLPSSLQQIKQNQLLIDLKNNGLWSLLDILYVFATDAGSDFATINWKSPTSNQITLVNSPTFTSNVGFNGNGSSSYLNTNWSPSIGVNFTQNNASVFIYSNTNSAVDRVDFGTNQAAAVNRTALAIRIVGNNTGAVINRTQLTGTLISQSTSLGLFQLQRTASNAWRVLKDGVQYGSTLTDASTGRSNISLVICAENSNGTIGSFTNRQYGFFGTGSSLSGLESNLYTNWNTYFTSL